MLAPQIKERNSCEDNQEAERGPDRADDPQVGRESDRRCQKDERCPGTAPGAIGTKQVWRNFAEAEQSDRGEGEENPDSENEPGIEFLVRAAQREERGDTTEENQCAARCAKARMNAPGESEK